MFYKKILPISLFFLIAILLFIYPALDTDLGWHLRVGEYITQTHSIPYVDFLSFSMEGYPYVFHSWLTEVAMHFAFISMGLWGVSLLFALILTTGLFVAAQTTAVKSSYLFVGLLFTPFIVAVVGIRTQVISYLLLTLLFYILVKTKPPHATEHFFSWLRNNNLWLLPILYAFWSNVHGGFALGLSLFVLYFAVTGAVNYYTKKNIFLLGKIALFSGVLCAICVVSTGLNPYGYSQLAQAVHMQTNTTSLTHNLDWRPLFRNEGGSFNTYYEDTMIVVLAVLGWFSVRTDKQKLIIRALIICFVLASFVTTRFSLILLVVSLPFIISQMQKIFQKYVRTFPGILSLSLLALILLGTLLFHLSQTYCAYTSNECSAQLSRSAPTSLHYPLSAVLYMKEHGVPERLFNNYNHGGYLHYHFPYHQFFIDGRMDNFFKDGKSFIDEYLLLINTQPGWEEIFIHYRFDGYLGKKIWPLTTKLLEKGWTPIVEDEVNILLLPPTVVKSLAGI